jgi:phage terminase large subunit
MERESVGMNISLPNDFQPREYQIPFMRFMDNGGRRSMIVWHRRSGKDLTALHQTCKMMHQRKGVYWHIYPTFQQARKAIWEGFTKAEKRIMENVFPGFLDPKRKGSIVKRKDEQQMMIELKCGSIWRLMGSDKIEVVGAGPVGVVFSEYAVGSPQAARMISPMLRENEGWEVYITTPRGFNHAKELYDSAIKDPNWFTDLKGIYETRAYDPDQTVAEERAKGIPDALIRQEYFCDWTAALAGAVWGDQIDEISKNGGLNEYDHGFDQIFTSWDIGYTDSTAIWFWRINGAGVDVIDFYESHGKPLSHYFDVIDRKPYRYVKHWLPHDARQQTLASGVNVLNQCLKHWPGQVAIDPDLDLVDGIQAGRWLLQQGIRFHPRCRDGIDAIRQYHYEYDEDKKDYSPRPAHDWSSHAADAFRYMATVVKVSELLTRKTETKKVEEPVLKPLSYSFTLDQLFEDHSRRIAARRRF